MKLYGLKNCDGCKKAMKALEAAGKDFEFIDIRTNADLDSKVPQWLDAAGAKALVNTRSTTYRELPNEEKAIASGDTPGAVLISHPTLIKRPVIEDGDKVYVGWSKATEAELT
ncbi:MAG: ArsC family transcriptional regulator [Ponticaulis sp.]|nr:ArsC family transcriptional regulator [Ponticaulis sp.]